jgi:hypothetical protein
MSSSSVCHESHDFFFHISMALKFLMIFFVLIGSQVDASC